VAVPREAEATHRLDPSWEVFWMRIEPQVSCLALAALVTSMLGPPASADLAEVKTRGALRVLVADSSPLQFCAPEGAERGLDLEILQAFAALQKVRLEVVSVKVWNALVPALLEGRGDLIACGFTDTVERRKAIAFTEEVFPTRAVVVTLEPTAPPTTAEELVTHIVGVPKGSSYEEEVRAARVPASRIVYLVDPTGSDSKVFPTMRSGKISATVMGLENAMGARRREPALRIGMFLGQPESLAFGLRKEDGELRRALDVYVTNVRRTATWSRLVVKYFGDGAAELLKKVRTAAATPPN
jgi:membrane-bound lytic murein transglycosylase F